MAILFPRAIFSLTVKELMFYYRAMAGQKRVTPSKRAPRKRRGETTAQGFYADSLTNGEKELLPEARQMEGLDEEIALLRVKLSQMVAERPEDMDGLIKAVRLLVQAVATKYRLSPTAVDDLYENVAGVINGIGGMLLPEAFKGEKGE